MMDPCSTAEPPVVIPYTGGVGINKNCPVRDQALEKQFCENNFYNTKH